MPLVDAVMCVAVSSYGSAAQYGPWPPLLGFRNNNLFYRAGLLVQLPTPNLEDQTSVFMTPGDRVAQLYPQALGTHFSRLLRHAWVTVGLFFNPGHHTGSSCVCVSINPVISYYIIVLYLLLNMSHYLYVVFQFYNLN
jgi:hypothetical protein